MEAIVDNEKIVIYLLLNTKSGAHLGTHVLVGIRESFIMQISITFRHMDATQAIRDHIDDKISHLEKYLLNPTEVHVILSVEKFRHRCEVVLSEQNFKASADGTAEDMYKSIDKSVAKIESHVKKYKKFV